MLYPYKWTIVLMVLFASLIATAFGGNYDVYEPEITKKFIYNHQAGPLKYNHCVTIDYYRGKFYAAWNANENRWEGKQGQKIYWAVSDDGLSWSTPKPLKGVPVFGNPQNQLEWQPELLNYKNDKELWMLWARSGGFIFSKMTDPDKGWEHRLVAQRVVIDDNTFRIAPSQEPLVLKDGSVLLPADILQTPDFGYRYDGWYMGEEDTEMYVGPVKTSDGGKTWSIPSGALLTHPRGFRRIPPVWEPMFVTQNDDKIRMMVRNQWVESPDEGFLLTSEGNTSGTEFEPLKYSAIRTIRSRMWLGQSGQRRFMIHHDSSNTCSTRDRINMALFTSMTGKDDFVAGVPIVDDEFGIKYPQAVVHDNALYVAYTSDTSPMDIKIAKVEPLPDDKKYYILPRSPNRALTYDDNPRAKPHYIELQGSQSLVSRQTIKLKENLTVASWINISEDFTGNILSIGPLELSVDDRGYLVSEHSSSYLDINTKLQANRWTLLVVSLSKSKGVQVFVDRMEIAAADLLESSKANLFIELAGSISASCVKIGDVSVYDKAFGRDEIMLLMASAGRKYGSGYIPSMISDAYQDEIMKFHALQYGIGEKQDFKITGDRKAEVKPGELEFVAGVRDSLLSKKPANFPDDVFTITGWLRLRPISAGSTWINALSDDYTKGFSLRTHFSNELMLRLGKEQYRVMKNVPSDNEYFFFALTVDNNIRQIKIWKNNRLKVLEEKIAAGTDISSDLPIAFAKYLTRLQWDKITHHFPLYGGIFNIKVYDKILKEEQIRHDYNKYADLFDKKYFSRKIKLPPHPLAEMNVDVYGDFRHCSHTDRPVAQKVDHLNYDGKQVLVLSGNGAAGVEMDEFEPESDQLDVQLPVLVQAPLVGKELRFVTFGDDAQVAVGLAGPESDFVYVKIDGRWQPTVPFELGKWNNINLSIRKGSIKIENNNKQKTLAFGKPTQRLYLGDGYPDCYIAEADRFMVNIKEFEAKIVKID